MVYKPLFAPFILRLGVCVQHASEHVDARFYCRSNRCFWKDVQCERVLGDVLICPVVGEPLGSKVQVDLACNFLHLGVAFQDDEVFPKDLSPAPCIS